MIKFQSSGERSFKSVFLLTAVILAIFVGRTLLATTYVVPRLFDLFVSLTLLGTLAVLLQGSRHLQRSDWLTALSLGALVGVGMLFATLFSPYPFFGLVDNKLGQAIVRGVLTAVATLGGLVIMRQGGPVQFHVAAGNWCIIIPTSTPCLSSRRRLPWGWALSWRSSGVCRRLSLPAAAVSNPLSPSTGFRMSPVSWRVSNCEF